MIHPLAREVAFWLGVKVVALIALFFLFFGPEHRPTITPLSLERQILAPDGVLSPAPSSDGGAQP